MAYDPAKLLELEQSKVQQAQENQILKQQVAELAKDKSLQEKNKSITKKHKDEMEKFDKMLRDADKQLAESLLQIKNMTEDKDLREKELDELKVVAQALVDMVDPPEESTQADKTLLERLQCAPQKIMRYLSDTTRGYVSHVLGLVKSYWPKANPVLLGESISVDYSEENFTTFVEEMKPIADKIVDALEQEPTEEP